MAAIRPQAVTQLQAAHGWEGNEETSMHRVAILAFHGVVAHDLGIPCDVFGQARLADGSRAYEVRVCGQARRIRSDHFTIQAKYGLEGSADAHTVVVPGSIDAMEDVPDRVLTALRDAAERGTRIASICTGAFVLAAAGLLDGRRATTHWLGAAALAERYPAIDVDPNVLFVDEGDIVTSAGASAGMDMCLHLVARDHGQAVAANSSRMAVAPLGREGGQRQFILHDPLPGRVASGSVAGTLEWIEARIEHPVTIAAMAKHAGMSARTFQRRFVEETGTTPGQCVIEARTRRARVLLETTDLPVEEIAAQSGFADASGLRERFRRTLGVSPKRYRASFGARVGRNAARSRG